MNFRVLGIAAFVLVAASLTLSDQTEEPVFRVGGDVTAPRPLNSPDPEYSEEARTAGRQGKCVLSLIVNKEGKPEKVRVSRSLGMGLDEKAVEAIQSWTFEPARKKGDPVAVRINIVVTFRLATGKKGLALMPPRVRGEMREAEAERRRYALNRVYRIESATPASLCHLTPKKDEDDGQGAISELKTDVRQYRLASINFTNNKIITNATALRSLFPIKDGEPFDPSKVADGLQELKTAYRTQGFVSFKSSVEPLVDESQRSIALNIKCDEGRQFSVDHINIEGVDEHTFQKVRKSLYVRPGDLYNEGLANLWLEKNSRLTTPDVPLSERIMLDVDENVGTLVMTYDFTRCTGLPTD